MLDKLNDFARTIPNVVWLRVRDLKKDSVSYLNSVYQTLKSIPYGVTRSALVFDSHGA